MRGAGWQHAPPPKFVVGRAFNACYWKAEDLAPDALVRAASKRVEVHKLFEIS